MLAKSIILLSLSFLFYSCLPLSINKLVEVDENEDWLYIGGDLAKTNISKSKSHLNPPFNLYWQFDTDAGLAKNCLSASDALLFANTLNGEFYTIDITSGKSLGRVSTLGKSSYSTPLVFKNNVVLTSSGDNKSTVLSYNLIKGAIQWQRDINWVESSPILINEDVIVSTTDGKLHKLNVRSGVEVWKFNSNTKKSYNDAFYTSPTISENKIFLGNINGNMYAIDIVTGKNLWKFKTDGSIYGDASFKDGKIYFGSNDKNFYCIDTTGNLIWKKNLNTKFLSSSTFYKEMVITTGVDGNVYSLNRNNGDIIWQFHTQGSIWASPLLHGDKIFIGSYDKNFYCLNADDGKQLWKYECEGRIRTSTVIWKDFIFVASDDKYIYCFSQGDGFPK